MTKRVKTTLLGGISGFLLLILGFQSELLPQASDSLQQQYKNALKLRGEDKYEQAISALQQIIDKEPQFSKAYRSLVETYIFTDDLEGARVYFENLLENHPQNAYAFYALARIDFARKEFDTAIQKLKKCIEIDPQFADAYSYRGGLPEVYKAKKDLNSAVQFFSELVQADPNNACAYYGLARTYIRKYNWQKALKLITKAIELDPELTLAYHAMIFAYFSTSRYDKVRELSEKLHKIADRTDDPEMIAYSAMMIGTSYRRQGEYLKAVYYFSEALRSAQYIGEKRREGICLNNLANVYAISGNYLKALDYFNEALRLVRKTDAQLDEVRTLTNIGTVYKDQGMYQEALKSYQQALEIAKKNKYRYEESLALSNMADVFKKRRDYNKTITFQNDALRIAKEIKDKSREGFVLRDLGNLNQDLRNYSMARNYHLQALEIGRKTKNVQIIWGSQAGIGASYERQGNLHGAIHHYARAIALYDSVRESLDIEALGNNFLEDRYQAYPSMVHLLAQNGNIGRAFAYAEKYKAKTILDILSQRPYLFGSLLSDSLQKQLQQITAHHETAHAQLSIELAKIEKDKRKILYLDQQITDLELRKAAMIANLKKRHSAYYQLAAPEALKVEEIQTNILRREQALVEYILGPRNMSVFVVTPDTLTYTRVEISRERLRGMLTDLSPIFASQESTDGQNRAQFKNPQLVDFSIHPAHALHEVLIKPIEQWLQDAKELIIVPDDVLFYLPFEMLVFDTSKVETSYDFANARFLLEKFDISYISSASLLNPDLKRPRKSQKGILAFGNPDFTSHADEPQQKELLVSKAPYVRDVVRGDHLLSLPKSELEVRAIDQVFNRTGNSILIGNRATEESFKSKANEYRILHLATHFITNDDQPLYSKIVLAQNNDMNEDGYLQTYEVFNMNLNADLVVLSACNTGLGKLRKGEGLIGISRAFLFAGVPSMVVSLWNVDDESTAIIMKNFYRHLQAGLEKKQALRLAKLDYLKSSQSHGRDPFYWAPFILIGDWSPVRLPTNSVPNTWIVIAVITLMVMTAIFLIRRRRRFRSITNYN